ncbi:MAG: hypothetical protein OJF62_000511 [Pseudolabrys sp.]|jgi:hypothetical protein|nr:hypothetical protein [Pseudolabrys sp.]
MKSLIAGCIVAIVIAFIGVFVLDSVQKPADQAFATSSVRL